MDAGGASTFWTGSGGQLNFTCTLPNVAKISCIGQGGGSWTCYLHSVVTVDDGGDADAGSCGSGRPGGLSGTTAGQLENVAAQADVQAAALR